MSNDQLQQAYQLIQAGDKAQAIALLEPLIRADRENDDAWWLLANATDDTDAKRNALNNVIRLTSIDSRRQQAQQLLNSLDSDPFGFDFGEDAPASDSTPSYTAVDETPKRANRGGLNCGTLVLGIIGLLGLCMLVGSVLSVMAFGDVSDIVTLPENAEILRDIVLEDSVEGVLTQSDDFAAYRFTPNTTDLYEIIVDSDSEIKPYILIYESETGTLVGTSIWQVTSIDSRFSIEMEANQEYVVATWAYTFLGQELGYGDYELTVEIRD